jgi:hypothetical protein
VQRLQHHGVRTVPGIGADHRAKVGDKLPAGAVSGMLVAIDSDPVLTGYIDNYLPEV